MEKVTVNQLTEEFMLDSKTILKELKKIGVMIFSANQPIDPRFVGKVTSHLKLLSNLAQEEEKRAERRRHVAKKRTVRSKPRKQEVTPLESAISRDMTFRKVQKVKEPVTEEGVSESATDTADLREVEEVAQKAGELLEVGEPTQVAEEISEKTEMESAVSEKVKPEEEIAIQAEVTVERATPKGVSVDEVQPETVVTTKDDQVEDTLTVVGEEPVKAKKAALKAKDRRKKAAKDVDETGALVKEKADKPTPIVRYIKKEKKRAKVLKSSSTSVASTEALTKGLGLFSTQDTRRKRGKKRKKQRIHEVIIPEIAPIKQEDLTKITIPEGLTVKEIAERMEVPPKEILKNLFMKGIVVNINQILDVDVIKDVGLELGFDVDAVSYEEELIDTEFLEASSGDYEKRPPVITVMGHVDHGKTLLLDSIKHTMVADEEAGGITQHIGAYMVTANNRNLTFIDTPGHEAFTMMRARGAKVTDIVLLVVAADDGVMPQTVEAIQHARAASVPIIVVINKIDKPNANPEKVKQSLSSMELVPEEWGGNTVFVEVSAKNSTNIDQLLEMIILVADMLELTAIPNTKANGTVIESKLDKTRGPVATLLVQNGTLFERDIIVAGAITGKIRAMYDENNKKLDGARPSTPVLVMGLVDVPEAGDRFFATDDATKARQLSQYRQEKQREEILSKMNSRVSLDTFFQQLQEGQIKELPLILKVDVQGSKDAIESMLNKLSTEKVKINILHCAVGAINENDVLLASASNAIIVGFNVKPVKSAEELAKKDHVDIHFYNVIYNIAEEIKKAMEGLLEYTVKENIIGSIEVRQTFRLPGVGTIVGGYVTDGLVRRDANARLFRSGVMVFEGKISSLKRFKEDATEVKSGYECGVGLEKFNDIKVDDELQIYTLEKVKDTLDS